MTDQERAAALAFADDIERGNFVVGVHVEDSVMLEPVHETTKAELVALLRRAYARPAPADLREAITCLLIETDAESYEDIADEIISLLPQTQEGDVQWKPEATAPYGVKVIAGWAPARGFGSHAELGKRHTDGSWSNNYGHPFSGKPDVWMEIPTIERLDCAADKEG